MKQICKCPACGLILTSGMVLSWSRFFNIISHESSKRTRFRCERCKTVSDFYEKMVIE